MNGPDNDSQLGDWHGAGQSIGRSLTADEQAAAYAEFRRAEADRARIDDAMADAYGQFEAGSGGRQEGREHSLKSWESYRDKVADDRAAGDQMEEAVQQKDLHRYTFTFPSDERYATGVEDAYQKLDGGGFAPVQGHHKNLWSNDSYQGINTVWEHRETGRRVEVQFHTPERYRVKQDNHPIYRVQRSPYFSDGVTPMRPRHRSATRQMQAEAYENVSVPPHGGIRPDLIEHVRLPDRGPVSAGARAQMEAEVARERTAEASRRAAEPEALPRPEQEAGLHGAAPRGPPLLPEAQHRAMMRGRPGSGHRDKAEGRDREPQRGGRELD